LRITDQNRANWQQTHPKK